MRYKKGIGWGTSDKDLLVLQIICYCVRVRIDYGTVIYVSALSTDLKKTEAFKMRERIISGVASKSKGKTTSTELLGKT